MALPKHKISRSRRDKRRTHKKLSPPNVTECSHCHQPKLPHKACPNCGYYGERMVLVPRER
ncbi:50S ribosomal protein L32 [bacterium]|nr:50S ribosomal protein L32 [bacterium]